MDTEMTKTNHEILLWGNQQYQFALKFAMACREGKIDPEIFQPETRINVEGEGLTVVKEWPEMDLACLVLQADNIVMTGLAACAISANDALIKKHGKYSLKCDL